MAELDSLCVELNKIVKQRVSDMLHSYNERNEALDGLFNYIVNMPEFKRFLGTYKQFDNVVQLSSDNIILEVESDNETEESDNETEESDNEQEESEMKLDLEIEFMEIEIDDVTYCTNDDNNGFIYKLDEDGNVGDKVGYIKDGEPIFYE